MRGAVAVLWGCHHYTRRPLPPGASGLYYTAHAPQLRPPHSCMDPPPWRPWCDPIEGDVALLGQARGPTTRLQTGPAWLLAPARHSYRASTGPSCKPTWRAPSGMPSHRPRPVCLTGCRGLTPAHRSAHAMGLVGLCFRPTPRLPAGGLVFPPPTALPTARARRQRASLAQLQDSVCVCVCVSFSLCCSSKPSVCLPESACASVCGVEGRGFALPCCGCLAVAAAASSPASHPHPPPPPQPQPQPQPLAALRSPHAAMSPAKWRRAGAQRCDWRSTRPTASPATASGLS